jgi:hypothetical protein
MVVSDCNTLAYLEHRREGNKVLEHLPILQLSKWMVMKQKLIIRLKKKISEIVTKSNFYSFSIFVTSVGNREIFFSQNCCR